MNVFLADVIAEDDEASSTFALGLVAGGQLQFDWAFSTAVHRRATAEALAQGFVEALSNLIAHCQSPEAGGFTPSDFPGATLT